MWEQCNKAGRSATHVTCGSASACTDGPCAGSEQPFRKLVKRRLRKWLVAYPYHVLCLKLVSGSGPHANACGTHSSIAQSCYSVAVSKCHGASLIHSTNEMMFM
jgi:hypothetical protein